MNQTSLYALVLFSLGVLIAITIVTFSKKPDRTYPNDLAIVSFTYHGQPMNAKFTGLSASCVRNDLEQLNKVPFLIRSTDMSISIDEKTLYLKDICDVSFETVSTLGDTHCDIPGGQSIPRK